MRTWARTTARTAALTAGFAALGATVVPTTALAGPTPDRRYVDDRLAQLGGTTSGTRANAPTSTRSPRVRKATGERDTAGPVVTPSCPELPATLGGGCQDGEPGSRRTSGTGGVGSGYRVDAPVSAPVNVCGNAVAIFGTADAGCREGASVPGVGGQGTTTGERGVIAGNQVGAPVSAPVNICGNAVAIFGAAEAECEGGASARGGTGGITSGQDGIIAGNQVEAPVSAPVNVCGNAVAIFGRAVASCAGGAAVRQGAGQVTSGAASAGGGNQVGAPVSAPVDVCGNAAGTAMARCEGGATVRNGGGQVTRGDAGVLSGNQVERGSAAPLSACGNAAGIPHEAGAFCRGGAHVRGAGGGHTSGVGGVAAGNQANGSSGAPSSVCGNTGVAVGHGAAACEGGATDPHGTRPATSGDGGVGSGNQGEAAIAAPASVCGNAGAVAGHPEPVCEDGVGRPNDRTPPPSQRLTRNDLLNAAGEERAGSAQEPPFGPLRFPITVPDGRRLLITAAPGPGAPRPAAERAPGVRGSGQAVPLLGQEPVEPRVVAGQGRRAGGDGARLSGGWPVDAGPVDGVRVAAHVPAGGSAGIAQGAREGAAWALGIMAAVAGILRRLW
ncbi:chaplin family protein [Spirillospora sp. NPDC029432]|uniref:chaplin family protein n=1 Tax=Spirillospora sp. NPDC029432 TaxID=3154599 RepID=UPI003456BD2C